MVKALRNESTRIKQTTVHSWFEYMLSIKRDVASVWCSWTHRPKKALYSIYMDAGFTTWDLADHYGPEDFIGDRRQLLATRGKDALSNLQAFTKWVPRPTRITKKLVEHWYFLKRMGGKRLTWSSSIGGNTWSKLPGRTQVYVGTPVRGKIKHP